MTTRGVLLIALVMLGSTLILRPAHAQNDFSISANPASADVQPGMAGESNITVVGTPSDTVTLTLNNILDCNLSSTGLTIASSGNQNATLSCSSTTVQTIPVQVNGTSGSFTHSILVTFNFKVLVNLDSNSISQVDTTISTTSSQAKSFRVGAVLNASNTNTVANVYGWQVQINYDATAFLPQGDPSTTSLYPDGADPTPLFGAQTTTGTANWAGFFLTSPPSGFGSTFNSVSGITGHLTVFYTLIGTTPAVTLSAKTILANVNFELINKPTTPQLFTITDVIFADQNSIIPTVGSGAGITETITNAPPRSGFTVTSLAQGDTACVPITGSNCSAHSFSFDGSTSSDPEDGTISSPSGFFWDFGDGTQDLAVQGGTAIHDYGAAGNYAVTLRVQDSLGATGSARDNSGTPITDTQPSHSQSTVLTNTPPSCQITLVYPSPAERGQQVTLSFECTDVDGTVTTITVDWGDGSTPDTLPGSATFDAHAYSMSSTPTFTIAVNATDNLGLTGTASMSETVSVPPTCVINGVTPSPAKTGQLVTLSFSCSDTDGTVASIEIDWGDFLPPDRLTAGATTRSHTYTSAGSGASGNFTIRVTATDNAGLLGQASRTITINGPQGIPQIILYTVLAIIAGAILAGLYILRRRGRKPAEQR